MQRTRKAKAVAYLDEYVDKREGSGHDNLEPFHWADEPFGIVRAVRIILM